MGRRVLREGCAMGTRDDRPETAPEVGMGTPPPGWYPDPAGGWGRRWWDGARWTNQVAMPPTPPAKAASAKDPDPGGGGGRRWWDRVRSTDQMALPRPPLSERAPRSLGRVFNAVFAFAVVSFLLAAVLVMGADACTPSDDSDRCLDLYGRAWEVLMVAHVAQLIGCAATFVVGDFTKRVAIQRWAIRVLAIGIVMAWIAYWVMASIALNA